MGITAGSRDVPGRNACDKRHTYCIIIIIDIYTKETEKLSQYKDLEIEVSGMWKVGTKIVPVIIGALGKIKKGLDQNLQLLPGQWSPIEL